MSDTEQMIASAHAPLHGQRLAGKVAIVSGAGSAGTLPGVGAATAMLMAAQGARVGLLDVDAGRAAHTLAAIERLGGEGRVVTGDIAKPEGCRAVAEDIAQAFGSLDIVVNNAAIARRGDIRTLAPEDWQSVMDVNLTGAFNLSQAAVPWLDRQGGSIVNISSIAGRRGFKSPAYAASKAGLEGLTRDMAATLGGSGVRVNCVVPGFIWAPMSGGGGGEAREGRRLANALQTEGSAWDIAFAALFLASSEARWITGECITVDAGVTIMAPKWG